MTTTRNPAPARPDAHQPPPDDPRIICRAVAGRVLALARRIDGQVEAGEPVGELDVTDELRVIAATLGYAGGPAGAEPDGQREDREDVI
jgi:hypothetical protein